MEFVPDMVHRFCVFDSEMIFVEKKRERNVFPYLKDICIYNSATRGCISVDEQFIIQKRMVHLYFFPFK